MSESVAGHKFVDADLDGRRDADPGIAIDHVASANYPGKPRVIDDVSLEVRRGDTVAVVGEIGLGQNRPWPASSSGLLPRQRRRRPLRRRQPAAAPQGPRKRDQLRRVQMIYQMPDVALNPNQRLLDVIGRPVEFYFKPQRARKCAARVLELLRQMDLPESLHLSSQDQRIVEAARNSASPLPARSPPSRS